MAPAAAPAPPGLAERLAWAAAALNAGAAAPVREALEPLVGLHRTQGDLQHLYGLSCLRLGDLPAAEGALRAALAADRRRPDYHLGLARVLAQAGREGEAERSLRAALALDRRHDGAAAELAELLNARGRPGEALQVLAPLCLPVAAPSERVLAAQGEALRQLGRPLERLAVAERAARAFPRSAVADHNLAASLGDLGRDADAAAAATRAFAKGLDAPETWLTLGRAELGQGRLDAAEAALRAALARRPLMADAHRELAQLLWMRTGEAACAQTALDAALAQAPDALPLHLVRLQLAETVGDPDATGRAVAAALAQAPPSSALHCAAARTLLASEPERARAHAETARRMAGPEDAQAAAALCAALLALGEGAAAAALAGELRRRRPEAQHFIAYQATAWRLLGDPRYRVLYDYALVRSAPIAAPPGWAGLEAYLADLGAALERLHRLHAHPFGQSLRGGSQTAQRLDLCDEPAVSAFFQAVEQPVQAYVRDLGRGKDPLRARNRGGHALEGAWSVRLRPGGGRHVDHVHQHGWLSSAFYVDLPAAVAGGDRQGWIKFGEPGIPTRPALGPEHWVRPEPGLLVLFPSYMWHGTAPFAGPGRRLSVAFDLRPAPAPGRPSRPAQSGG